MSSDEASIRSATLLIFCLPKLTRALHAVDFDLRNLGWPTVERVLCLCIRDHKHYKSFPAPFPGTVSSNPVGLMV